MNSEPISKRSMARSPASGSLFRHPAWLLRRTESLRTTLIAVAFWTLAVIALTNLRYVHLGGMPKVEGLTTRATMACCALLLSLVGARCVMAWRKSGSLAPIRRTLGGTPGMLLFAAVASYLAIGASVLGMEAIREPDTAGLLKYSVLHLGVLAAAAVGGRAVLERTGAERLLRGVLLVLIVNCAVILASPVLRDLGILPPYRIPFRLTGFFLDPNDASLAVCMTVALAAGLLTNGGGRALGWLGLAAGLAASLATASRTALVVLGALAVVFLLINVRSKPRTFILAWAATGLTTMAAFAAIVGFSGGFSQWWMLRSTADVVHEGSLFCDPSPTGDPGADCAVLLAMSDILAGDMALNWHRAVPVNRWQGVTVDGPEGRVTGLDLAGLGLNGRIPPDLGRLDRLVSLSLSWNRLTGPIPPELGNLSSLEHLNLSHNDLAGGIPPALAKLENLDGLWLKHSRLTGPVPAVLGELDLSVLRLVGNDFDAIPPELAAAGPGLVRSCQPLPPTTPALFDDCTVLLAVKNTLAGDVSLNWHPAIPVSLWQGVRVGSPQERVVKLLLSGKGLNGRIPPELGSLDGLVEVNLSHNRLTGPIPPELGRLVGLRNLSLDYNVLTGAIPAELGQLSQLESLWLRKNRLTGPVSPAVLATPEHDLDYLEFCTPPSPPSPTLFDDCTRLLAMKDTLAGEAELNWSAALPINEWEGASLSPSPKRVVKLLLSGKGLNGRIPPELGSLDGLVEVNLSHNRLTGPIPPELGRLVGLRKLSLDYNVLTGAIPAELGQLSQLESLWLRKNRLTGPVSPAVLAIPAHDLDYLEFCTPPSPPSPTLFDDCTRLLAMKDTLAGEAELNWSIALPISEWEGVFVGPSPKRVVKLLLSGKGLNGRIPPELGSLDGLVEVNLSHNRLTGPIPPELGRLVGLRNLRLDYDVLTSPVPPKLFEIPENTLAVCQPPPRSSPELFDDCVRLLTMKDTLAGRAELNWSVALPINEWQGVTVGGPEGRVIALELPRMRLNGRIPSVLGHLAGLRRLVLDGNLLTGTIPPELGKLTDLEILGLADNVLTGPIPPELAELPSLKELWLSGNHLSDSLPPELRSVAGGEAPCPAVPADNLGLRADCALLLATRDILSGDAPLNWSENLPIEFWQGVTVGGSLARVTKLELSGLGLNGRIPPELGRLSQLVSLDLKRNRLTGPVPPELGELTNLEYLVLSFNALSGPIPPELGKLPHLRELRLKNNRLSGSVPAELEGLEKLTLLRLSNNDLDRPYSRHLFGSANNDVVLDDLRRRRPLGDAETAEAADRRTNRDRPDVVRRLFCRPSSDIASDLQADCALLLASRDILSGDAPLNWSENLPIEFWQGVTVGGSLARVTKLELSGLGLNGRIPPELGRLSQLVSLDLKRNRLTGPVPPELGELTNLEYLVLSFNALSGPIPPELGKLPHLRELRLKNNRLSGSVPAELEGLEKLTLLRLSNNDLDRPYSRRLFGSANNDIVLDDLRRRRPLGDAETAEAADRRTNRDRPDVVRRLFCRPSSDIASDLQADCALLLASRDILSGDAPLNWSEDIPIEFWQGVTVGGSPKRVTALELPRAGLNGRLSAELGELGGLVALNLSHNRLTGPVPPELEGLDNLFFLRLAGNDLNRPFPPALHKIVDHDLDTPVFCRPRKIDPGLLADCTLLLRVRDALAGDAPLNWREEVPVDDWLGVAADRSRGRVTALDLTQMGLNGRIPAELGQLAGLVSLRLGRNRLAGGIPPELGNLVDLRMLALNGNLLAGSVPPELGKLSRLTDLWLHGNRLIGPAPPSVAALPKLVVLRLDGDDAVGELPAQDRGRGGFSDRNLLCQPSFAITSRLHGDCATLLDARDVLAGDVELNWSDAVPIGHWRGVTVGPASDVGAVEGPRVVALDLSHMGLNGRIPAQLSALDGLAVLRLGDNRLAGSIPPELGALSGLRTLVLENNALAGAIPEELGALQGLVSLRLGNNELSGLTRQFTTLTNLRVLALENNVLTGNVDPQIGSLQRLEELRFENNRLHGNIPTELDWLARLVVLRLGGNAFSHCIPAASRAARTRHNDLESADLLCETSPWTKPGLFEDGVRLMQMRDILAGDAVLNWSYDRPIASWQGVTVGAEGRVITLDLRDMNLTGRIPPQLSELKRLYVLRLDHNRLTGAIPPQLGNLNRLVMLSLDGNRLTGPIPPALANLSNLSQLWLADNRLTGSIPPELAGIERLSSLAVAGNDFNGYVPWELHRLRSHDIDDGRAALVMDRLLLWRLGFEKAMEAPIFGHGLGTLVYLDGAPIGHQGRPLGSHNLYLTLLGEAGIVPLLLFVSATVLLLRAQWAAPKSLARDATVAWIIVIALYCMSFEHLLSTGVFMFLAGLSVATGAALNDGDRHVTEA